MQRWRTAAWDPGGSVCRCGRWESATACRDATTGRDDPSRLLLLREAAIFDTTRRSYRRRAELRRVPKARPAKSLSRGLEHAWSARRGDAKPGRRARFRQDRGTALRLGALTRGHQRRDYLPTSMRRSSTTGDRW